VIEILRREILRVFDLRLQTWVALPRLDHFFRHYEHMNTSQGVVIHGQATIDEVGLSSTYHRLDTTHDNDESVRTTTCVESFKQDAIDFTRGVLLAAVDILSHQRCKLGLNEDTIRVGVICTQFEVTIVTRIFA